MVPEYSFSIISQRPAIALPRYKPDPRAASRSVLLVLSILILLGLVGTSEASISRFMFIDSQVTVGSPTVVLQNGTTGTSLISDNDASAKVSVSGYGYDFVDSNDTDMDSSADKGTQSNFTAQKYGPDMTNDTLAEENTGGGGDTNYEIDLEVQWTTVDYDETYEELCIRTGSFSGSEDLMMYAWNASASDWQFLANSTANSWNNVSISDWLVGENFTVRFLGGTETSDAIQNYWDIDAALLHVWTETDYDYDYVLRVNNTDGYPWEIRLLKYSDSNLDRLQNCTVYFHSATDGISSQLVIESGSFISETGPWYDLEETETIYIAMKTEANSTGISNVYAYLEIRNPGTSTYRQYFITYEIT